MNRIHLTLIALLLSLVSNFGSTVNAQTPSRERLEQRRRLEQESKKTEKDRSSKLSVRAETMNNSQRQDIFNAKWQREIYRFLDLEKDKNAPLYNPVYPTDGRMSLFSLAFNLLLDNKINAYEYVDGRELFSERYKLNIKDFLSRFDIIHREDNGTVVVDANDVPSAEVLGYYVKEAYYLNPVNSSVDVKTIAICPILYRQGDFESESMRYPLFWIEYDDLRPYAQQMPLMVSNMNNAVTHTIDDFFRSHLFEGEIYKTGNLRNLAIKQYAPSDSLYKYEQMRIEKELDLFIDKLWVKTADNNLENNKKNKKKK